MKKLLTAASIAAVISVFAMMSVAMAAPEPPSAEFAHPGKYEQCANTNPYVLQDQGVPVTQDLLDFWTAECDANGDQIADGAHNTDQPDVPPSVPNL